VSVLPERRYRCLTSGNTVTITARVLFAETPTNSLVVEWPQPHCGCWQCKTRGYPQMALLPGRTSVSTSPDTSAARA
jgi:hypothetical protein